MLKEPTLHLPTGSGAFTSESLRVIAQGFEKALRHSSAVLPLTDLDVFVVHAPTMTIPGWGCGGYTYSAHSVILAADPQEPARIARICATLVHELHHIARERGPGCGTSLRERVVSEGLAMLFEEQVLGQASEFAHQAVSEAQMAALAAALDEDPADDGRWFFHSGEMPLWLGYTAGYRWASAYSKAHNKTAAELTDISAGAVTAQATPAFQQG